MAVDAAAGRDESDASLRVQVRLHDEARGRDGAGRRVHASSGLTRGQRHQRLDQRGDSHRVVAFPDEALALRSDRSHLFVVVVVAVNLVCRLIILLFRAYVPVHRSDCLTPPYSGWLLGDAACVGGRECAVGERRHRRRERATNAFA